jgi:hypothetical protein
VGISASGDCSVAPLVRLLVNSFPTGRLVSQIGEVYGRWRD